MTDKKSPIDGGQEESETKKMSSVEKANEVASADKSVDVPEEGAATSEQEKSAKTVKRGAFGMLTLILATIVFYLVTDRHAPYTTQARLQGYVVGVAPKVSGLVTGVFVKNNTVVKEDQVLFEIDPSQYQIALDKALSDLGNAQSQVDAGSAGVDSARANLLAAQANQLKAQQDLSRLTRLHKEDPGTISVRRIEVSRSNLEQAKAGVTASKAEIQRAIEQKGGVNVESNTILLSAQSAVEKAELDLSNTKVRAATDGVITDLTANTGQYANAGSPVMTLVAIQDVWINAEFTENNLGHMKEGSDVEIVFDSLPGRVFTGSIRSIGLGVSVGQTQPQGTLPTIDNNRDWLRQAQRFPVMVSFDVKQDKVLERQLRIGGQAAVIVYTKESGFIRWMGELYIRIMSWTTYAY